MDNNPKVLYFDLETSPCIVETWGTGKQYIGAEQIRKERKVFCICYKWAQDKKVHRITMDMSKHDLDLFDDDADKEMLIKFSEIYNSADIAVAHNGRAFDLARVRARLVKYGLPDLAPILFDDSYVFSKDKDFTSHKLDYLCRYLNLKGKTSTSRKLWSQVMDGSKKALKQMVDYCSNDVVILEQMYLKLKPYCKSKLNLAVFYEDSRLCPSCGGELKESGHAYTTTSKKKRYRCKECGSWFRSGKNLIEKPGEYPR